MVFKVALLVAVLAAGAIALPASPEQDNSIFFEHVDVESRLVGADVAPEGSAPHMVALTSGLILRSFLCGGSIVTPNRILTAAHCIDAIFSFGSLSSSARATVGTNRWNLGGVNYQFSGNITHPNYVSQTIKNDIGFLITRTNIAYTPHISNIPLALDHVSGGVLSKVTGWGRIRAGGSLSTQLLELYTATIDGDHCVQFAVQATIDLNFVNVPPVEPHIELCTYHSPGFGNCNGDSGSALVRISDGQQIGVVSWGFPCALGAPDMFARVSGFSDWIAASL